MNIRTIIKGTNVRLNKNLEGKCFLDQPKFYINGKRKTVPDKSGTVFVNPPIFFPAKREDLLFISALRMLFLTKICFQSAAVTGFLQTLNSSFFDLADTFFCKIIFLPDLLDSNTLLAIQAKISIYNFCFSRAE